MWDATLTLDVFYPINTLNFIPFVDNTTQSVKLPLGDKSIAGNSQVRLQHDHVTESVVKHFFK